MVYENDTEDSPQELTDTQENCSVVFVDRCFEVVENEHGICLQSGHPRKMSHEETEGYNSERAKKFPAQESFHSAK